MMRNSGTLLVLLPITVFITALLIPGSNAQVRLEFTASIEVPSLKCITTPQQVEFDVKNKTVCFCIWIQNVIPTWNCMRGDGKAGIDDLKMLMETIRNLTAMMPSLPPITMQDQSLSNGEMYNPFRLPEPYGDINSGDSFMAISPNKKGDDKPEKKSIEKKGAKGDASSAAENDELPSPSKKSRKNPFSDIFF